MAPAIGPNAGKKFASPKAAAANARNPAPAIKYLRL
jgi:hypothetical protein